VKINDWCKSSDSKVGAHSLIYFEADEAKLSTAVADVAATVPGHYTAANRVAHILDKLGKTEAAEYVAAKLPTGPRSRSGDIGEILASSWVSEFTGYRISVLKLRWKDHREMAMRGDDILAVCLDPDVEIRFLKGEVKSRASVQKKTVDEARKALLTSDGRPTPHALTFVSDRLFEAGETELSDLIDKYQLKKRIKIDQLSHLMFMFTGNNPCKLMTADLDAYKGKIQQYAVGLRVTKHQDFIKQIFEKVIADGDKP
jgi:HamA